jgi:hypothetical protein
MRESLSCRASFDVPPRAAPCSCPAELAAAIRRADPASPVSVTALPPVHSCLAVLFPSMSVRLCLGPDSGADGHDPRELTNLSRNARMGLNEPLSGEAASLLFCP